MQNIFSVRFRLHTSIALANLYAVFAYIGNEDVKYYSVFPVGAAIYGRVSKEDDIQTVLVQ